MIRTFEDCEWLPDLSLLPYCKILYNRAQMYNAQDFVWWHIRHHLLYAHSALNSSSNNKTLWCSTVCEIPISPMKATSGGTFQSWLLLAVATAIAKSAATSLLLIWNPPITFVCMSIFILGKGAYFLTMASIWLSRLLSMPLLDLRGGLSFPYMANGVLLHHMVYTKEERVSYSQIGE